jgi:2-dehydro-3-deoxygluconokinase
VRICVIGEGMLELSRAGDGWRLGHGGDTLNTAIHLARLGFDVAYVTALGTDPFSDDLIAAWKREGLDVSLIARDAARMPGLYAIRTDGAGERSFHYWREDSAARGMFALPGFAQTAAAIRAADVICFSLITLAILPDEARRRLLDLCQAASARGARVVFDGNYRPRLWPSAKEARRWRALAAASCDIGLPTFDDEKMLSGAASADEVATQWSESGARETIVKLGGEGCRLPDGAIVAPPKVVAAVDTSGAGDAFNAGYLAARLRGGSIDDAARAGHALAGWVVMRPGAIPDRDADAPYPTTK